MEKDKSKNTKNLKYAEIDDSDLNYVSGGNTDEEIAEMPKINTNKGTENGTIYIP